MHRIKWMVTAMFLLALGLPAEVDAASRLGSKWFQVKNRVRVEYDSNIYQTEDNEEDSNKVIEEADIFVQANWERTFLSLHYRPQFVWWDNRDPDDTQFNNSADLVFEHEFSPRFSFRLKDTFLMADQATLIETGNEFGRDNDYKYNSVLGTISIGLTPETDLDVSGRYQLLRYDDDAVSRQSDYNIYAGGLDVRHQMVPETSVALQLRGESTDYDQTDDRDSESAQIGGAVEQTFSPQVAGEARLGYQMKTFDDDGIDDINSAYFDGALTMLPSPATRVTLGAGFDQADTDVSPYANQQRVRVRASVGHDFTSRISLHSTATYSMGDYDADEAVASQRSNSAGQELVDGSENIVLVSGRLVYRLNRSNSIEAGWQMTNVDSDVREDYSRHRLSMGWRTEL